tara:strand:+ start:9938 stop:10936 length:999 start_codon:yes stop_codon:yes gene_type:complete
MDNILLVDPLSEKGHHNINQSLINILSKDYNLTFISEKNYLESSTKFVNICFPEKLFGLKMSFLPFRFRQIAFVLYSIFYYRNHKKYEFILFTSYETISFSFSTFFVKLKNIAIIEHNNLDQLLNSKIKEIFYRLIRKNIVHIVLEQYIYIYINQKYRKKVSLLALPLSVTSEELIPKTKLIFSPSTTFDEIIMRKLINFCSTKEYLLIAKGKSDYEINTVTVKTFFDNYYDIMRKSSFVFISTLFNYRVSNVAYEALANNRPIIGFRCLFLEGLKEKYSNAVFIIDDIQELEIINIDSELVSNDSLNFKKFHSNENILNQFRILFSSNINK